MYRPELEVLTDIEPLNHIKGKDIRFRQRRTPYLIQGAKVIEIGLRLGHTERTDVETLIDGRMLQAGYLWQCGSLGREEAGRVLEEVTPLIVCRNYSPLIGQRFDFSLGGYFDSEKQEYNAGSSSRHRFTFAKATCEWKKEFRNFLMEQNLSSKHYLALHLPEFLA